MSSVSIQVANNISHLKTRYDVSDAKHTQISTQVKADACFNKKVILFVGFVALVGACAGAAMAFRAKLIAIGIIPIAAYIFGMAGTVYVYKRSVKNGEDKIENAKPAVKISIPDLVDEMRKGCVTAEEIELVIRALGVEHPLLEALENELRNGEDEVIRGVIERVKNEGNNPNPVFAPSSGNVPPMPPAGSTEGIRVDITFSDQGPAEQMDVLLNFPSLRGTLVSGLDFLRYTALVNHALKPSNNNSSINSSIYVEFAKHKNFSILGSAIQVDIINKLGQDEITQVIESIESNLPEQRFAKHESATQRAIIAKAAMGKIPDLVAAIEESFKFDPVVADLLARDSVGHSIFIAIAKQTNFNSLTPETQISIIGKIPAESLSELNDQFASFSTSTQVAILRKVSQENKDSLVGRLEQAGYKLLVDAVKWSTEALDLPILLSIAKAGNFDSLELESLQAIVRKIPEEQMDDVLAGLRRNIDLSALPQDVLIDMLEKGSQGVATEIFASLEQTHYCRLAAEPIRAGKSLTALLASGRRKHLSPELQLHYMNLDSADRRKAVLAELTSEECDALIPEIRASAHPSVCADLMAHIVEQNTSNLEVAIRKMWAIFQHVDDRQIEGRMQEMAKYPEIFAGMITSNRGVVVDDVKKIFDLMTDDDQKVFLEDLGYEFVSEDIDSEVKFRIVQSVIPCLDLGNAVMCEAIAKHLGDQTVVFAQQLAELLKAYSPMAQVAGIKFSGIYVKLTNIAITYGPNKPALFAKLYERTLQAEHEKIKKLEWAGKIGALATDPQPISKTIALNMLEFLPQPISQDTLLNMDSGTKGFKKYQSLATALHAEVARDVTQISDKRKQLCQSFLRSDRKTTLSGQALSPEIRTIFETIAPPTE